MLNIKNSILRYVRVANSGKQWLSMENVDVANRFTRPMCASASNDSDKLMDRVIGLVKKFDRIDSSMVTETSDFQKDMSLDSLDRVELVMAFEQEFSVEIPEEVADKLTCCADVAKYLETEVERKNKEN